jgi:hypothetical protein
LHSSSHVSQQTHDEVAVFVGLAEPNNHATRQSVHIAHVSNLAASFGNVFLVDADGVDPHCARLVGSPEML